MPTKAGVMRVLLVEDDELFRLGLSTRLQQEPGLQIMAEVEDGESCLEILQQLESPDVVLLDVGLPGIGGVETCRQIRQYYPQLPILVLTSHDQPTLIRQLLEVEVQGYCLKGLPTEFLILALRSVAGGASWWDAVATAEIKKAFREDSRDAKQKNPLTQREQEILSLIVAGKSNQEIAADLYITPGTVRVHVHAILHKLGVRDRTQAAVTALQKHWISTMQPSS